MPSAVNLAKTLTAASIIPAPEGNKGLEAELRNALAARDAAMFELSDVLKHNVLLLKKLREKGGNDPLVPHQTYAEDLLSRRKAIASHTGADDLESDIIKSSPRAEMDPLNYDYELLTKAVGLSLDRLRELRWKELLLQADISDFTGLTPHSKSIYDSLSRLAKTLPEKHPMTVKIQALASVVEEMGATRAELAVASEKLNWLRAKKDRGRVRGEHAVWTEIGNLRPFSQPSTPAGSGTSRSRSPSPNLSPSHPGSAGATFSRSPRETKSPQAGVQIRPLSPPKPMSPTRGRNKYRAYASIPSPMRRESGVSPTRMKAEQQWLDFVKEFEQVSQQR